MKKPNETITEHTNAVVPILAALIACEHPFDTEENLVKVAARLYDKLWDQVATQYDA